MNKQEKIIAMLLIKVHICIAKVHFFISKKEGIKLSAIVRTELMNLLITIEILNLYFWAFRLAIIMAIRF